MALYALGDLHLAFGADKPMDVFGGRWQGYADKLREGLSVLQPEDTLVIPGDFCWALDLEQAIPDFAFLESFPGRKLLVKGNHDYWWDSQSKVTAAYPDMVFIKNNCYIYRDVAICGTRGWLCPNDTKFDDADKKVYNRECVRMKLSLDSAVSKGYGDNIIIIMHYPPMNDKHETSGFTELFDKYSGIKKVLYGHLHGKESIDGRFEGDLNGVEYELVSADFLNFTPVKIMD